MRFAQNPRSPDAAGCCAQSTTLTRSYEADFTPKYAGYRRCLSAFLADCAVNPKKRVFLPGKSDSARQCTRQGPGIRPLTFDDVLFGLLAATCNATHQTKTGQQHCVGSWFRHSGYGQYAVIANLLKVGRPRQRLTAVARIAAPIKTDLNFMWISIRFWLEEIFNCRGDFCDFTVCHRCVSAHSGWSTG